MKQALGHGAVLYDVAGYGMTAFGHNPAFLLDHLATPQVCRPQHTARHVIHHTAQQCIRAHHVIHNIRPSIRLKPHHMTWESMITYSRQHCFAKSLSSTNVELRFMI
jgi:hypothetical protein